MNGRPLHAHPVTVQFWRQTASVLSLIFDKTVTSYRPRSSWRCHQDIITKHRIDKNKIGLRTDRPRTSFVTKRVTCGGGAAVRWKQWLDMRPYGKFGFHNAEAGSWRHTEDILKTKTMQRFETKWPNSFKNFDFFQVFKQRQVCCKVVYLSNRVRCRLVIVSSSRDSDSPYFLHVLVKRYIYGLEYTYVM